MAWYDSTYELLDDFCKGSRSLGHNDEACKEWLQVFSLICPAGWQWDWGSRDSSHWRGSRFYFPVEMLEICSVEVEIFFAKQADLHVLPNTSIAQVQHKQNTRHSEQNLYIRSGSLHMKLLEPPPRQNIQISDKQTAAVPCRTVEIWDGLGIDLLASVLCVHILFVNFECSPRSSTVLHNPQWSSWYVMIFMHNINCRLLHQGERDTLCVSSQVGCRLGCRFCATGVDCQTRM